MNTIITKKPIKIGVLFGKIQLPNHLPHRTTPNCSGITKGVMRDTSPIVFCFLECPYLLTFLLHLTPPITFLLGTFFAFGFSAKLIPLGHSWVHFLWIHLFFFPRRVLHDPVMENQEPHPGKNLDTCRAFSSDAEGPLAFNGSQVQGGERSKNVNFLGHTENVHSMWQRFVLPKCKQHYAFEKHHVGKSNSWPFIHYFLTSTLKHFASTAGSDLSYTRRSPNPVCPTR